MIFKNLTKKLTKWKITRLVFTYLKTRVFTMNLEQLSRSTSNLEQLSRSTSISDEFIHKLPNISTDISTSLKGFMFFGIMALFAVCVEIGVKYNIHA